MLGRPIYEKISFSGGAVLKNPPANARDTREVDFFFLNQSKANNTRNLQISGKLQVG